MNRKVVVERDVRRAVDALILQGRKPSVVNVRLELQRGSYRTIKRYLGPLLDEHAAGSTTPPLSAAMTGLIERTAQSLWSMAWAEADQQFARLRAEYRASADAMKERLDWAEGEIRDLRFEVERQASALHEKRLEVERLEGAAQDAALEARSQERLIEELRADRQRILLAMTAPKSRNRRAKDVFAPAVRATDLDTSVSR